MNGDQSMASSGHEWWRRAVVYQLYVRSFRDHDGDGIGDLHGVTDRIDYIAALGVDAIWLNPCYPSPNRDGGYDVADYVDIDATYGGLPAFEKLLTAAHERDIRVMMDLVPNHCSSSHPWFQEALASAPGSAARARFHFRDGRGPDGSEPPNNWRSTFSGSAWTRVTGPDGPEQWYLHSFDAAQPDFNWANPDVAAMFDDVLTTWFDRGVDGFRIDVAYAMVKHPDLPDAPEPYDNPYMLNQPGVHDIFARWRAIADRYGRDIALTGEVWLSPSEAVDYIRPGRLHQVFYFDLLLQPWRAQSFRASIDGIVTNRIVSNAPNRGGSPALTLNNHDVHRSVSRYGLTAPQPMQTDDDTVRLIRPRGRVDVELGVRRARAAALLLLALPASVYLYQGEELGLPEVLDLPDDARRDPIWFRSGGREHGRDGSRIPLPWRAGGTSLGFSPPGSPAPWLPQPDWYRRFAVDAQQDDPASTLAIYRAALRARRRLFGDGDFAWLDAGRDDVLAFRAGRAVNVTVMGDEPFVPSAAWGEIVLRSHGVSPMVVEADSSAWLTGPGATTDD
ncbi:MAG TPA: glycoside hydrolase family 13 protein [Micromonosporaceae bacterium]|nr:glycoside hydrolase family 13 protein [Micromonosporaceae bacterium]